MIDEIEFEAVLVTLTVPLTLPIAAGAKVAFKIAVCPGVKISPVDMPLVLKPGPEILTLETIMLELPVLLNVTARVLLLPTLTLLKFKVDALAVSCPKEVELTVRGAAVLVTLPAELLTITLNWLPLSEVVVAGIV